MKLNSIVDVAKKYIENRIINGDFVPGKQLKEEDIASRLKISRPPIREAFKILESEGLINIKPRRGAFVSIITEKDIWEIYTLKESLYGLATRLAFENMTIEVIGRLENILKKMEECVEKEPPDIIKYQNLNEVFHFSLVEISKHDRLKRICKSLSNQTKRLSYFSLIKRENLLSSYEHHIKILESIKDKNVSLAERINTEHILNGLNSLISMHASCEAKQF